MSQVDHLVLDHIWLLPCSYLVCVGTIDQLWKCFTAITGPIMDTPTIQLVVGGLNFVVSATACLHYR